jgi:hypothetical protein
LNGYVQTYVNIKLGHYINVILEHAERFKDYEEPPDEDLDNDVNCHQIASQVQQSIPIIKKGVTPKSTTAKNSSQKRLDLKKVIDHPKEAGGTEKKATQINDKSFIGATGERYQTKYPKDSSNKPGTLIDHNIMQLKELGTPSESNIINFKMHNKNYMKEVNMENSNENDL